MRALKRNVHDVWCTCSFNWLAGALRVIIAALATSRASTQTTFVSFVKFVAAFSSLLFVWFAGDMKSKRPSKDHE